MPSNRPPANVTGIPLRNDYGRMPMYLRPQIITEMVPRPTVEIRASSVGTVNSVRGRFPLVG
jgi:hypothetical protein